MKPFNCILITGTLLFLATASLLADAPQAMLIYRQSKMLRSSEGVRCHTTCLTKNASPPTPRDSYRHFAGKIQVTYYNNGSMRGKPIPIEKAISKGWVELVGVGRSDNLLVRPKNWKQGDSYKVEVTEDSRTATTDGTLQNANNVFGHGELLALASKALEKARRETGDGTALKMRERVQRIVWAYEQQKLSAENAKAAITKAHEDVSRAAFSTAQMIRTRLECPVKAKLQVDRHEFKLVFGEDRVLDLRVTLKTLVEARKLRKNRDAPPKEYLDLMEWLRMKRLWYKLVLIETPENLPPDQAEVLSRIVAELQNALPMKDLSFPAISWHFATTKDAEKRHARLTDWVDLHVLNAENPALLEKGNLDKLEPALGTILKDYLRYLARREPIHFHVLRSAEHKTMSRGVRFFIGHRGEGALTLEDFKKIAKSGDVKGVDVVLYTCNERKTAEFFKISRMLIEKGEARSVCFPGNTLNPRLLPLVLHTLSQEHALCCDMATPREALVRSLHFCQELLMLIDDPKHSDQEVQQRLRIMFPDLATEKGRLDPVELFKTNGTFDRGLLKRAIQNAEDEASRWFQTFHFPKSIRRHSPYCVRLQPSSIFALAA